MLSDPIMNQSLKTHESKQHTTRKMSRFMILQQSFEPNILVNKLIVPGMHLY